MNPTEPPSIPDQPIIPPPVQTPPPPTQHSSIAPLTVVVIMFLTFSLAGFLFYQNQMLKKQLSQSPPPIADQPLTPTATPTQPAVTEHWKGVIASPTPTPNYLLLTYKDTEFGYSISYNKNWEFRRTFGKDIPKSAQTDVMSGIDLHKGGLTNIQGSVVVTVLDAHSETDPTTWISQYDLNAPQNASPQRTTFKGDAAILYQYRAYPNNDGETWYILHQTHVYRIFLNEPTQISPEMRALFQSFQPA